VCSRLQRGNSWNSWYPKEDQSQSRESTSYNRISPTKDGQGGVEPERQDSGIEQVRLKGDRQMPTFLSHIKEIV